MMEDTLRQFGDELKNFFVLVILNLVFGALALAFGMQIIIATLLRYTAGGPLQRSSPSSAALPTLGEYASAFSGSSPT